MRISTISDSVSTLAIEPVMKNSEIDCVWAMPKADATVPSRLAAPPKVTTGKAYAMYSEPEVGPVAARVVTAESGTPGVSEARGEGRPSTRRAQTPEE